MAQPKKTEYPPTEFSLTYAKILAPNGKLISPEEAFGEGGIFDKEIEKKTRFAFKLTMKKLEKYNKVSEHNVEALRTAKVDQIVECFPNTAMKLLPNTIQKNKWSKKAKDVENWDNWWECQQKIINPLKEQAEHIFKWWEFTGKPNPGVEEILDSLKRIVTGVLSNPLTIGKVISAHGPKRKKDRAKSIHLMGTDTQEAAMIYAGFTCEILHANPLNPIKLTMVSPNQGNKQLSKDCGPSNPMLIHDRCKFTAWDGLYHDFWERFVETKKVEKPDIVMAIHPRLESEFWVPTLDLLLDENIKTVLTTFNKDQFIAILEKLDPLYAKYIYRGPNDWVSGHVKQTPHDPNMVWASNQFLVVFQGRTVDLNTLTLIEDPNEEETNRAEEEFEKLLEGL